jgi:hypothetical protein
MRVFIAILMFALLGVGCRTHNVASEAGDRPPPVSQAEVRSMAEAYIVAMRGACGTGISAVEDGGELWIVQTVYGFGERPGPDLHIDKLTRRITVVHD